MGWIACLLYYFLGAFTFLPLVLVVTHLYVTLTRPPSATSTIERLTSPVADTSCHKYDTKQGWIYISSNYQSKPRIMVGKGQSSGKYGQGYGVFKQGILKIYSDEMQRICERTLDLNHYTVSLYPPGRKEHIIFSRSVALRLVRKPTTPVTNRPAIIQDNQIFFSCTRPIDKEDWYFAFLSISDASAPTTIPFDPISVASLITFINKDSDPAEHQNTIPWFNAILGRTFLGIYKTERLQNYVFETLTKKTQKMKTTAGFLGEIKVRSIDLGYAIPYFTQPTLISLDPDGTLILDAQVDYTGGFKVVVETTINALSLPLVLSLTLRSLSGTIRFKIKPPPSNRYWIGFCTMPKMKWSIVPAVSNYNVKLSMVTKIIESKIRRMMTDNMVLPNMEDIPFARSDGLGGLFSQPNHDATMKSNTISGLPDTTHDPSIIYSPLDTNRSDGHCSTESSTSRQTVPIPASSSGHWSRLFTTRRRKNTAPVPTAAKDRPMMHKDTLKTDAHVRCQTGDDQPTGKTDKVSLGNDGTKDAYKHIDIVNGTSQSMIDAIEDTSTDAYSIHLPSSKSAPTLPTSTSSSSSSISSAKTAEENTLLAPSIPGKPTMAPPHVVESNSIDSDNIGSRQTEHGIPELPPRPSVPSNTRQQSHWMSIKVGGQSI